MDEMYPDLNEQISYSVESDFSIDYLDVNLSQLKIILVWIGYVTLTHSPPKSDLSSSNSKVEQFIINFQG